MPEFSERFFRSGTLRIHFRDWGDPALPPLVIVHGLRDHSHSFDDLARGLLDHFHVLALDLRGHGDSETTPYYGFGHFVLDLHNLIRALRLERPVVVGHSMGGEVVASYCGMLSREPGEGGDHRGPRSAAARRWTRRSAGPSRVSRASIARWSATPDLKDLEAAYRRLRERNPRLPEQKARELALLGTRAREDGTLEWKFDAHAGDPGVDGPFDLEYVMALWRRIAAPTLVVHGAESGEFWRGTPGAIYLEPDDLGRRLACFRERALRRDRGRRPHGALRPSPRAVAGDARLPARGASLACSTSRAGSRS